MATELTYHNGRMMQRGPVKLNVHTAGHYDDDGRAALYATLIINLQAGKTCHVALEPGDGTRYEFWVSLIEFHGEACLIFNREDYRNRDTLAAWMCEDYSWLTDEDLAKQGLSEPHQMVRSVIDSGFHFGNDWTARMFAWWTYNLWHDLVVASAAA